LVIGELDSPRLLLNFAPFTSIAATDYCLLTLLLLSSCPVTIGILGSTTEAQAQFKLVPKFVKKKTPLEQFIVRKVSFL